MHLAMAVSAAAGEQEARGLTLREARTGRRHTRMIRLRVALLTQQRRSARQQRRVDRAMRAMTIAAILGHRRVLPQERAALFCMAAVARLIQRRPLEQSRIQCIVGRMAGRAAHIAVAHRMRRKLVEVCANLLVALVTNHGLLCFHRDRIVFLVHAMTADAGDIFALVHTALPANPMAALMASEAGAVLLGNARLRIRSEQRYRRSRVADMELLRMFC